MMNDEYISRKKALMAVCRASLPDKTENGIPIANGKRSVVDCVRRIKSIPAADVRPVGLLEQVEWERDTALAQLAEIGKSFGEKMDDVRPVVMCRDCIHYKPQQKSARWSSTTPMCSRSATIKMPPDGFCSFGEKREES